MSNNKVVLPGEQVSTSEELLPGEGTFEEDGIIRSYRIGTFFVDKKHKKAIIKPLSSVPIIVKKGDIVIARVASVRSNMVIAEVIHVIGKNRSISGETSATLRVSEISNSYTKDPSTEYSTGDYIRAKVIQIKPSLQLATKDKDLGVIKATCSRCRNELTRAGKYLECKNCKNRERRNIAVDFENFDIKKF